MAFSMLSFRTSRCLKSHHLQFVQLDRLIGSSRRKFKRKLEWRVWGIDVEEEKQARRKGPGAWAAATHSRTAASPGRGGGRRAGARWPLPRL